MKKNNGKLWKFMSLFLTASVVTCLMTGCMKSTTNINVSSTGSGTITSKISIEKDSLIAYYKAMAESASETISDEEIMSALEEEGFILETIDGVEYYTTDSSEVSEITYSDIPEFYENYGTSLMSSEDNNYFSLSETSVAVAMPKNSSILDSLLTIKDSGYDMSSEEIKTAIVQYSVTFDTEITNYSENAVLSEDKKTVSFSLPFIAEEETTVYAYCVNDIPVTDARNGMVYTPGKVITLPQDVTATVNGLENSGTDIVCEDNGYYDVKLKNSSGTTETLYFTVDATAPEFSDCKNGGYYNKANILSVSDEFSRIKSFTVDGKEQISDSTSTLNEDIVYVGKSILYPLSTLSNGKHTFTATDSVGNSASIKVTIDNKVPVVKGVKNGKKYTKPIVLKFSDNTGIKSAKLNGKKIKSGKKVTKKGSYTLIVTDKANNVTTVKFKIK